MIKRRLRPTAIALAELYRYGFRLAQDPETTPSEARDWIKREAAMLELHGPIVAELACRKEMAEYEDATGLCCTCGGLRHDADQF